MLNKLRAVPRPAILGAFGVLLGVALGATVIACSGTASQPTTDKKADITSPASGLKVTADIASVTLGDDCGTGTGGFCQASNLQLAFIADAGNKGAAFEIVKAELLDASSGAIVDTLTTSAPQVWNGTTYVGWDQNVTPGGDLKASYALSPPAWSKIEGTPTGAAPQRGADSSYSKNYRLRLTLHIDGAEVILESTLLNRQPVAAT